MNPENNNQPLNATVPVFDSESTMAQVPQVPQPVSPPPPAIPSAPRTSSGSKTIVLLLVVILLLVGIGLAVFKFLVPNLTNNKNKETTLTWWGLWEDQGVIGPLISEYQTKNPNVKIQYQQVPKEDYRERLTNSLAKGATGGAPDIFAFHNSWVPMFASDLDAVPATVFSPSDYSQTFFPVASADLRVGQNFVGIPFEFDGLALFINQDIFQTYNKVPPKTWDELRQTALELTIRDQSGAIKQAGVALGRTENVDHWPEILGLMMLQNGVNLTNPTDKKAQDALQYFTVFSSVDRVWDNTLPPSTVAFASGKVAMYFGPSWRVFDIKQMNKNLKFSVIPVPQLPKTDPNEKNVTYASYWANGVSTRSTNKDAAWEFLKFLSTKESYQKLYANAAGIRGYGEPYPRVDMASSLTSDPVMGAFIQEAPDAVSWYLQSRTFDGPTGINSQINKYFEDAVNAVNLGTAADKALTTAGAGVTQTLVQYGIIAAPRPTQ